MSSFPLQVWVAGDLDSNLDSASPKEVEMLIVVMVIKIKIIKNNNLNSGANVIPILQKGTLRLKEMNFLGHMAGPW